MFFIITNQTLILFKLFSTYTQFIISIINLSFYLFSHIIKSLPSASQKNGKPILITNLKLFSFYPQFFNYKKNRVLPCHYKINLDFIILNCETSGFFMSTTAHHFRQPSNINFFSCSPASFYKRSFSFIFQQ